MKNNYKNLVLLLFVFLFCNCNEDVAVPKLECTQPDLKINRTVEDVMKTATITATKYVYDDVIESYVVSSDENGNFFKILYLQTLATETKPAVGFSVAVDATNTYIDYRVGNKVYIKLKDQFTDLFYGGMRIGSLYEGNSGTASVGRISQNDYKNVLHASCKILNEDELVNPISIEKALDDSKLNTLIELSDVQFLEAAIGRHYFEEANNVGGSTNWSLRDKSGNQIIFRTSSFADFSTHLVPEGSGKVRGILTKYGSDYQLMVRSEKDVVMDGKSNVPFFTEDFQTVTNNVNFALPDWSNIVEKASKLWRTMVSAGNGYAEFNTTSTTAAENVAWLITPKINLTNYKNTVLSFRSAQHDLKVDSPLNALEVYISTNFDGSNVEKATWIKLNAKIASLYTQTSQNISSGGIDSSAYSGNINIAFKYTGSGKDKTLNGAFMVDDVKMFGEK
ncbi:MAG: DUF5689 domain-containing protein [Chryseobacterium taeanense]